MTRLYFCQEMMERTIAKNVFDLVDSFPRENSKPWDRFSTDLVLSPLSRRKVLSCVAELVAKVSVFFCEHAPVELAALLDDDQARKHRGQPGNCHHPKFSKTLGCCTTRAATFSSYRWNVSTNPDLAFASVGQDKQLPDRRLGKFPRSQHRPSHNATETKSSCPQRSGEALELS